MPDKIAVQYTVGGILLEFEGGGILMWIPADQNSVELGLISERSFENSAIIVGDNTVELILGYLK